MRAAEPPDITEDIAFDYLLNEIDDLLFRFCVMIAPTVTFNTHSRDKDTTEIYGRKNINADDKNEIRKETLIIVRMAKIAERFCRFGIPWVIGAPASDGPSPFDVPEIKKLLTFKGLYATKIEHARLLGNLDFSTAGGRADANIENYFLSAWRENSSKSGDDWAFPILRLMSEKNLPVSPPLDEPAELQDTPLVQRISFTSKLRGEQMNAKEVKQDEDRRSLCGLRNTSAAVSRAQHHRPHGVEFRRPRRALSTFWESSLADVFSVARRSQRCDWPVFSTFA